MTEPVKYYKVIGADNRSCHGGDFDWTEYLPKGDEPGKWTPAIKDIEIYKRGYHVTRYWNMWYESNYRVFECEVRGEIAVNAKSGVEEKIVAGGIRLIGEVLDAGHLVADKTNTGEWNIGHHNSGDQNLGSSNTGDANVGDYNSGNHNLGNNNTGSHNTGSDNRGFHNIGNGNIGNNNLGDLNIGNNNLGDLNIGGRNIGNRNMGNWNKADRCIGHFNTITADGFTVFNKPCTREGWESHLLPDFIFFEWNHRVADIWRLAYDCAGDKGKLLLIKLPNFDADVFYEISGIRVDPKTGQEIKKENN